MHYFDHAATTPMDHRVHEQVSREMREPWNASSVHRKGQSARAKLEEARDEIAHLLGLRPVDVVFTSGASEANNLAIRGLTSRSKTPLLAVSSPLEHPCVRGTLERLAADGMVETQMMQVDPGGRAILPPSEPFPGGMLCLMAVQNETGVIQRLEEARAWRLQTGARWLCDATQALGKVPIDFANLGADLVSLSSHKIYGPAGVGALLGPAVDLLAPIITGGPQEGERRAGTQPVALIRGFVLAARLALEELDSRTRHLRELEDVLLTDLRKREVSFELNGDPAARTPGFLSLFFPGITGADLTIALDVRGFCVSSGSACSTGVMELSPALSAMFPNDSNRAAGALRVVAGKDTDGGAMVQLVDALRQIIPK